MVASVFGRVLGIFSLAWIGYQLIRAGERMLLPLRTETEKIPLMLGVRTPRQFMQKNAGDTTEEAIAILEKTVPLITRTIEAVKPIIVADPKLIGVKPPEKKE